MTGQQRMFTILEMIKKDLEEKCLLWKKEFQTWKNKLGEIFDNKK